MRFADGEIQLSLTNTQDCRSQVDTITMVTLKLYSAETFPSHKAISHATYIFIQSVCPSPLLYEHFLPTKPPVMLLTSSYSLCVPHLSSMNISFPQSHQSCSSHLHTVSVFTHFSSINISFP